MKIKFPFRIPTNQKLLTVLSFRNKGHLLFSMLMKINIAVGGKTRQPICRGTYSIIQSLLKIKKHQGLKGLTSYLKTCSVSCQQALGGHVHPNLTDLNTRVSRTAAGIPKVLPVLWRSEIFTRPILARYILSIFAIYRFFLYESAVKVKAITSPFSGDAAFLASLDNYIPIFFKTLSKSGAFPVWEGLDPEYEGDSLFPILTQSPTSKGIGLWSSHRISVMRAWLVLSTNPAYKATYDALYNLMRHFDVPLHAQIFHPLSRFFGKIFLPLGETYLGKLGLKQEAAGKMRVFAMVDPITQWALLPIHRFIFDKILSKLPMDGTFHQTKPLERSRNWKELYSLDLSSATDRLPISLQANIIEFMWPGMGGFWKTSLVDRPYYNPETKTGIYYAVGQPMGAYSSWAMLALTHHFIVQVAAWKACVTPIGTLFKEYAVLGDDVVIGNSAVKDQYLLIIKKIGVECGLHKSLLSPSGTALEFAKRTWHLGIDVSPITIKDLGAALLSVPNLVSFMRHHHVPLPKALAIAGFGYKVIGGLNKPFHKLNQLVRNLILTTLLPTDINEDTSNLFGRSSLTLYRWESSQNYTLLAIFDSLFTDILNQLTKFNQTKNPNIYLDIQEYNILKKQHNMLVNLRAKVYQILENLRDPVWFLQATSLSILSMYLECLKELTTVKGMSNTEAAKASYGVDPLNVKLWKLWSTAVSKIASVPVGTETKEEVKFLQSSLFLPVLSLVTKFPKFLPKSMIKFIGKSALRRGHLLGLLPLIWYITEWMALLIGLLLIPLALGII
jgi:hypothetical protein